MEALTIFGGLHEAHHVDVFLDSLDSKYLEHYSIPNVCVPTSNSLSTTLHKYVPLDFAHPNQHSIMLEFHFCTISQLYRFVREKFGVVVSMLNANGYIVSFGFLLLLVSWIIDTHESCRCDALPTTFDERMDADCSLLYKG